MPHERGMPSDLMEAVRTACLDAAIDAYEDAGIQGLCADGRWEAAVSAIREVDLSRVIDCAAEPAPLANSKRDGGPVRPSGSGSPT